MERMPDARAGWQIPDRNSPWIRTIKTVDPLTGVPTVWRQDLRLFSNRRTDAIPGTGFRRFITQRKPSLKFPFRPANRPFVDTIKYDIEETVGDIRYVAGLEDAVDLVPEFQLGISDIQEYTEYKALYRPNTLADVYFFKFHELKRREDLPVGQNLNELLDLVKAHGEDAFVLQRDIGDTRNQYLRDFNEKAINWTQDEKTAVADKITVWLRHLLQAFFPNEKSDSHEMSIMFKCLYLETMVGLPRDFETQAEEVQKASFRDEFTFAVSKSLQVYEDTLTEVREYIVELTFGLPTDPVSVTFQSIMDKSLHPTKIQDGERQHFDIYNFSIERGEGVTVAFQRLIRPYHRYEFTVPKEINVDEFRRIASSAMSVGWEKAKEVAWARYVKV